ncbi:MAG: hypothetical protein INR64_13665, partial [Caulobacteraceae bacterium]|nr:hypothetical protein [Caulobacter sp.]
MSTVTFDTSILANYYAAKAALANVGAAASATATATAAKAPTAPWAQASEPAAVSALTASVIAGARFIDPSAAKLDAPATAASSADYRNLF